MPPALRSACSGTRSTIRSAIRSTESCFRLLARRCGSRWLDRPNITVVAELGGRDAGPQMVEARLAQAVGRLGGRRRVRRAGEGRCAAAVRRYARADRGGTERRQAVVLFGA